MSKVVVRPARYRPYDGRMRCACQNGILLRNEKTEHGIQPLLFNSLARKNFVARSGRRLKATWPYRMLASLFFMVYLVMYEEVVRCFRPSYLEPGDSFG